MITGLPANLAPVDSYTNSNGAEVRYVEYVKRETKVQKCYDNLYVEVRCDKKSDTDLMWLAPLLVLLMFSVLLLMVNATLL